jgi:Arc/MetJ-type ribon-helix-helix transcriptional regulator
MLNAQYMRIERSCKGGIYASNREFIKQARKLISKEGLNWEHRAVRHAWLRQGLEIKHGKFWV